MVAIIIQPPRLDDTVPDLFSSRTVAWSDSSRSCAWSTSASSLRGSPSPSEHCHPCRSWPRSAPLKPVLEDIRRSWTVAACLPESHLAGRREAPLVVYLEASGGKGEVRLGELADDRAGDLVGHHLTGRGGLEGGEHDQRR